MTHHPEVATATPFQWADATHEARTAAIVALSGMTADAMAPILGTTRSAILGHAWRHGVKVRGGRAAVRSSAFQPGRLVAPETWKPLGPPVAEPTRKQCCWPVGEAGGSAQMFCGLPRTRNSYCTTHTAMASGRRPADHPYVDMLRAAPAEVTIEEAVALVLPARKEKMEGAE
jgi:hypothetical protein